MQFGSLTLAQWAVALNSRDGAAQKSAEETLHKANGVHPEAQSPTPPLSWAERVAASSNFQSPEHVLSALPIRHEQPFESKKRLPNRRARGLVNGGNSCFINVILQALVSCDPFRRFLVNCHDLPGPTPLLEKFVRLSLEMSATKDTQDKGEDGDGSARSKLSQFIDDPFLPDWFHDVFPSSLPQSDPSRVVTVNGKPATARNTGSQEDAQEFLTFVLNGLHEELLAAGIAKCPSSSDAQRSVNNSIVSQRPHIREEGNHSWPNSKNTANGEDGEWHEMSRKGRVVQVRGVSASQSPVTNIFGGVLRSELKRSRAKLSVTREPFLSLSLDIDSGLVRHVEDALRAYFQPERLEGYTVENSQETVEARKQVLLEALPPVLILHLKRFSHNPQTGALSKVARRMDFPEFLTIPPSLFHSSKTAMSSSHRTYRLTAAVTHIGKELVGGHYVCDTRLQCSGTGLWVTFDDSKVTLTNLSNVLRRQAYLLFYSRALAGD